MLILRSRVVRLPSTKVGSNPVWKWYFFVYYRLRTIYVLLHHFFIGGGTFNHKKFQCTLFWNTHNQSLVEYSVLTRQHLFLKIRILPTTYIRWIYRVGRDYLWLRITHWEKKVSDILLTIMFVVHCFAVSCLEIKYQSSHRLLCYFFTIDHKYLAEVFFPNLNLLLVIPIIFWRTHCIKEYQSFLTQS